MRMTKTFASVTAMALIAGTAFAQDAVTTETETDAEIQAQTEDAVPAEGGAVLTTEGEVEGEVETEANVATDGEALPAEGEAETTAETDAMPVEGEAETTAESDPMPADGEADAEMTAEGDAPLEGTMDTSAEAEAGMSLADINSEDLDGAPVFGIDDDRLGEISELILDDTGKVKEVVIDVGGFLGLGEKPVAVNFEELRLQPEGEGMVEGDATDNIRIYVDMTEEQLENLPEYEG